MPETFPPSIEDCFLLGGFVYQDQPNTIRSQVEVGPAKLRRRFVDPVTTVNGGITVDQAQLQTFNTFYRTTLLSGVNSFNFADPVSGVDQEYRFIDPPVITPITDTQWAVSMNLEILP